MNEQKSTQPEEKKSSAKAELTETDKAAERQATSAEPAAEQQATSAEPAAEKKQEEKSAAKSPERPESILNEKTYWVVIAVILGVLALLALASRLGG